MKASFLLSCLFFLAFAANAQNQKILKPFLGSVNDFTPQTLALWQKALDNVSAEYAKLSAQEKKWLDSLEQGYGPMTDGMGCSWYCGGQMKKLTASSTLAPSGSASYKAENLHDFDLRTAWVTNKNKGIGEKLHFNFAPLSPRVNEITIFNGFIKSGELFKQNARVKTLKLYIDGVYYATLNLEDTTAGQTYTIAPIRSDKEGKDLILTLEITEVYRGSKYSDLAISEINFSGLDVH